MTKISDTADEGYMMVVIAYLAHALAVAERSVFGKRSDAGVSRTCIAESVGGNVGVIEERTHALTNQIDACEIRILGFTDLKAVQRTALERILATP
jgi:hypothetical protein